MQTLPSDGLLAVCASYPNAVAIARRSTARVVTYAGRADADYVAQPVTFGPDGARFSIAEPGGATASLLLPMSGHQNVENAVGAYAVSRGLGLSPSQIADGFATFAGVKRRQEIRGEIGGVLVIDDFAHHPTAVRQTIEGIRLRYPRRRLWAVFEPRSNTSRRNIHQEDYGRSFSGAARVSIKVPEAHDQVPANERLDVDAVVASLRRQGVAAESSSDVTELVHFVSTEAQPGDLVLVMSNGAFGGLIPALLAELGHRFAVTGGSLPS